MCVVLKTKLTEANNELKKVKETNRSLQEYKTSVEEVTQDKNDDVQVKLQEANSIIASLQSENKELREESEVLVVDIYFATFYEIANAYFYLQFLYLFPTGC